MASSIRAAVIDDWIVPAVAGATEVAGVARERPREYRSPPAIPAAQGRQGHPFAWVFLDNTIAIDGAEVTLNADVLVPIGVAIEVAYRIEKQWADSDIEQRGEEIIAAVHRAVMDRVKNDPSNLPAGVWNVTLADEPFVEPAPEDGFAVATLHFQIDVTRSFYDLNETRAA